MCIVHDWFSGWGGKKHKFLEEPFEVNLWLPKCCKNTTSLSYNTNNFKQFSWNRNLREEIPKQMAAITTKIKHQWRRTESTQTEVQPSNFSQSFQRTPCLQDPRLYEMCTRDRLQEALENIASKKPAGKYREDAKSGLRARIWILAKVAFWELNKKNWKTGKGTWSKYTCPTSELQKVI